MRGLLIWRSVLQADTNPYVDKRRVFDPEAQLDASDGNHGSKAYPWDPTLDPQIWRSANPHCGDGKLLLVRAKERRRNGTGFCCSSVADLLQLCC